MFIVFAFLCCFSVDMVLCFSFFTEPKKGGFGISTCRPHGALLLNIRNTYTNIL